MQWCGMSFLTNCVIKCDDMACPVEFIWWLCVMMWQVHFDLLCHCMWWCGMSFLTNYVTKCNNVAYLVEFILWLSMMMWCGYFDLSIWLCLLWLNVLLNVWQFGMSILTYIWLHVMIGHVHFHLLFYWLWWMACLI